MFLLGFFFVCVESEWGELIVIFVVNCDIYFFFFVRIDNWYRNDEI